MITGLEGLANRCHEHGPPAGADCLSGELICQPVAGVRKSVRVSKATTSMTQSAWKTVSRSRVVGPKVTAVTCGA